MNPRYPIYIPSKGRYETRHTMKALDRMNVLYRVVVEEEEYSQYAKYIDETKLLVLDKRYQREYDTCDDLGDTKPKGSGPARNFIWDHAISEGHEWHWIMDDNIRMFNRFNKHSINEILDGVFFRAMEDFVLRYINVVMAGPHYCMFIPRKDSWPRPFVLNTRIYSCNLIRNDIPFRWRARYNEDTDLSLRILKAGYCTVLFYAFLQDKLTTQLVRGGNTDTVYKDGTYDKSQMLVDLHPDVAKLVWRYGRWHHHVDYRRFKKNKLKKQDDIEITNERDEYGMKLIRIGRS